jgi:hypothetical protein
MGFTWKDKVKKQVLLFLTYVDCKEDNIGLFRVLWFVVIFVIVCYYGFTQWGKKESMRNNITWDFGLISNFSGTKLKDWITGMVPDHLLLYSIESCYLLQLTSDWLHSVDEASFY